LVRLAITVLLGLLAAGAAACGSVTGEDRPGDEATLLLDFVPNAVHAGIYMATARDFDEAEGVELKIRKPGASTDALKLLQAGRADMAILDIHDLGLARQAGRDIVGVMALVQRPLAALLAQPAIRSPADLEGKRAGVTGLPSDEAVLRSIVAGDGGDPAKVHMTTIGFQAVKALLAGRVAGATAFWNVEGVALHEQRPGFREFRVDDYGAPPYPEVILITSRKTLEQRRDRLRRALAAIVQGLRDTLADPDAAARDIAQAAETSDVELVRAQLEAVAPVFAKGLKLDREVIERWADFDARIGIVDRRPDVQKAFEFTLLDR
jgi:putative hydroxymethylpyrimidine transport system substrate-binding protein